MNIETLVGMSDDDLNKALGLNRQLEEAKKGIKEMNALQGDARKEAEERVSKMFQPNVYPGEFKWIAKDAERHAAMKACKAKTAEEEMCDCSPSSLMDD